ncbi:hypothetical protein GLYMA_09G058700v4 [Glycine max]|uniref:DUF4228 domain-containing protein n=1 Tax=Glycine max TaxID=3847 RepID=K7LC17_SOYBN|nr:uncharacterized protein LOC100780386 [Glycine max]KAG5006156.1 hypothetical protein JHK85_024698 [Glycine max]KAG5011959.1 hypothetical protein JHK86_024220 [Glycine max]KAH1041675.1 hypothetical protein GYH30_024170 [Glycine max]KAH1232113.1 hypothetical protein GmHk_09G024852 [Glycine max]KRH37314.1 hypothetical protein GLYMA_09G058700v4 [Glycine max]|eukprot:XP_003534897.1 uncharacterized protein LOC100780386 [Glycine max]
MGGCFSSKPSFTINNVRLVHLSGYVEDFENPISVSQVTGTPPKHFVCTSVQLLSSCSKPLNGDTQLQPGNVYFMLPYSILQADVSPVDLASLAKRLTAIAKTRSRKLEGKKSSSLKDGSFSSNVWSSPSRSPGRLGGVVEQIGMPYGGPSPCRVRPWKPILDTIREKSFNRRSESDLQEHN